MEESRVPSLTTVIEDPDLMDRFDSGVCLSCNSFVSVSEDVEKAMKKMSIKEEDEFEAYDCLSHVPSDVLFYQNSSGDTLLHLAVIGSNLSCSKYILQRALPGQLDIQNFVHNQTPIHIAVATSNLSVIKELIKFGSSTHIRDSLGNTPVHLACQMGSLDMVKELLSKPAKNFPELNFLNYDGRSCLHLAIDSRSHDRFRIVEYLVCQHSANISQSVGFYAWEEGKCGYSILHELVLVNDVEGVRFLLDLSIPSSVPQLNLNVHSYDQSTPLDFSIRLSLPEISNILHQWGAICFHGSL